MSFSPSTQYRPGGFHEKSAPATLAGAKRVILYEREWTPVNRSYGIPESRGFMKSPIHLTCPQKVTREELAQGRNGAGTRLSTSKFHCGAGAVGSGGACLPR